jgi:hypothetical protein
MRVSAAGPEMLTVPGNVAYWHKADIRGTATICPLLE